MIRSEREQAHSVTAVLEAARKLIECRARSISLFGELSEWRRYPSGHCYGTIRDAHNELSVVMYRNDVRRLDHTPAVGTSVVVSGRLTVYAAHGKLQCVARELRSEQRRGQSALARDRLFAQLEGEGFFESRRKRTVPTRLKTVGVVTSPRSAALGDIVAGVGSRAPWIRVVLAETAIVGPEASMSIATALSALARSGLVDLVILARGGGSAADLDPFNSEIVARAIGSSPVPVVSAIGHELHTTIADAVADLRAPTPSSAVALVLPDREEIRRRIAMLRQATRRAADLAASQLGRRHTGTYERLGAALRARLEISNAQIRTRSLERICNAVVNTARIRGGAHHVIATRAADGIKQRIRADENRIEDFTVSAAAAVARTVDKCAGQFAARCADVDAVSPLRRMSSGCAFVERQNGMPLTSVRAASSGEVITVNLLDGVIRALVIERHELSDALLLDIGRSGPDSTRWLHHVRDPNR